MSLERLPTLPSRYGSTPAEVWLGDFLQALPSTVLEAGMTRVLVVTDPGVRLTDVADQAVEVLRGVGLHAHIYDDVWPDPSEDDVERCAEAARDDHSDGFVAIGGGSTLDTAKGAAFVLASRKRMRQHVGFHVVEPSLMPLVAVPTTSGTGSEVQSFALISRADDHAKMACGAPSAMPRAALLDPRLTVTASPKITAIAGLDALVHALETSVTTVGTEASVRFAIEAFGRIWRHLPRAWARPGDLEARMEVQIGACMAGQAIEASMLGAAHAAANPLTQHFEVPHGVAVALMAPHVVRWNGALPDVASVYARLGVAAGLGAVRPDTLAEALEEMIDGLGLTRDLVEWDVDPEIDLLAGTAAEQWTGRFNPRPLEEGDFAGLYEAAFDVV